MMGWPRNESYCYRELHSRYMKLHQSGTFRLADQGHSITSPYCSVGLLVSNRVSGWIKNRAAGEEVMTLTCQKKLH
jgi:hypothetical protein